MRDYEMAQVAIGGRYEEKSKVEEIVEFLQTAIDGTVFELNVNRRRETTLMRRSPNQRSMSTVMDTESLGQAGSAELKKTYEQGTWRSGEWGERLKITPVYGDRLGERSTSKLRILLTDYLDCEGGHVGHALADAVEGSSFTKFPGPGFATEEKVSTLEQLRDYLTVAAAILGADRVASHLATWADGKALPYQRMALLVGVRLDETVTLDSGIRIERLPVTSGDLPESLPGFGSEAPETYLGGVILSLDCQAEPALFKPKKGEDGHWEFSKGVRHGWVLDGSSIDAFCECLSLSYGECIRCKQTWRDFGELREFSAISSRGRDAANIVEDKLPGAFLTQRDLEEAWELHSQRISRKAGDGIETAIGRWVSSKRPEASLQDQFIDLRIALEALYLDGSSQNEMSFRIATYGAWHAGGDIELRRNNFDALRKAYNISSKAIHAGPVKDSSTNRELLKTVQDLCKTGIKKKLAEDGKPNWTKMILGG